MSKNPAAVALGRLGGQVKSDRKAAAARKNGQKGGWPKGKARKGKKREQPKGPWAYGVMYETDTFGAQPRKGKKARRIKGINEGDVIAMRQRMKRRKI